MKRGMSEALSETQAALARAQGLAALDGLAAAAAHELGSPLATIAVVSNELSREIPADSPLAEDVQLIIESVRAVPRYSSRHCSGAGRARRYAI